VDGPVVLFEGLDAALEPEDAGEHDPEVGVAPVFGGELENLADEVFQLLIGRLSLCHLLPPRW
jgi:hypothetical protein